MKTVRRVHGVRTECEVGANEFIYTVAEAQARILGAEIVGQSAMCSVNMYVLDPSDTELTQFGYDVQIGPERYTHFVERGVDLVAGLKLKCVVYCDVAENIGVNFILDEIVYEVTGEEPDVPAVTP